MQYPWPIYWVICPMAEWICHRTWHKLHGERTLIWTHALSQNITLPAWNYNPNGPHTRGMCIDKIRAWTKGPFCAPQNHKTIFLGNLVAIDSPRDLMGHSFGFVGMFGIISFVAAKHRIMVFWTYLAQCVPLLHPQAPSVGCNLPLSTNDQKQLLTWMVGLAVPIPGAERPIRHQNWDCSPKRPLSPGFWGVKRWVRHDLRPHRAGNSPLAVHSGIGLEGPSGTKVSIEFAAVIVIVLSGVVGERSTFTWPW